MCEEEERSKPTQAVAVCPQLNGCKYPALAHGRYRVKGH